MNTIIHGLHKFVFYILIVNILLCDIHLWGGYFGSFVSTLSFLGGFVLNCRNEAL